MCLLWNKNGAFYLPNSLGLLPPGLDLGKFLLNCPRQRPREYTIASAPSASPKRITLCVPWQAWLMRLTGFGSIGHGRAASCNQSRQYLYDAIAANVSPLHELR